VLHNKRPHLHDYPTAATIAMVGHHVIWLHRLLFLLIGLSLAAAYEVPVEDTDYSRQICSGMWANEQTYINVTFDATSQGQLAMVIYEWSDVEYLGKVTSSSDEDLPVSIVLSLTPIESTLTMHEAENLRLHLERSIGWFLLRLGIREIHFGCSK
jgi:hypothetical protein